MKPDNYDFFFYCYLVLLICLATFILIWFLWSRKAHKKVAQDEPVENDETVAAFIDRWLRNMPWDTEIILQECENKFGWFTQEEKEKLKEYIHKKTEAGDLLNQMKSHGKAPGENVTDPVVKYKTDSAGRRFIDLED